MAMDGTRVIGVALHRQSRIFEAEVQGPNFGRTEKLATVLSIGNQINETLVSSPLKR